MKLSLFIISLVLWTSWVFAEEPARAWKAGAEAGVLLTRGNTDTDSVNTKMTVENDRERWRHRFGAVYLSASDQGAATAEKTSASANSEYKMGDLDYLFAVLRAEGDRFSGYSALSTESAGYGRRFIAGDRAILEMEAGAGARQTHFVDGSRRNEGIVRLGAKAVCRFSAGSELREEAFSEISKDNIHTKSVTSIKSKVNGNLSMKLSVSAVHNSRVPPGIKKTDTVTAMTLVFDY